MVKLFIFTISSIVLIGLTFLFSPRIFLERNPEKKELLFFSGLI